MNTYKSVFSAKGRAHTVVFDIEFLDIEDICVFTINAVIKIYNNDDNRYNI